MVIFPSDVKLGAHIRKDIVGERHGGLKGPREILVGNAAHRGFTVCRGRVLPFTVNGLVGHVRKCGSIGNSRPMGPIETSTPNGEEATIAIEVRTEAVGPSRELARAVGFEKGRVFQAALLVATGRRLKQHAVTDPDSRKFHSRQCNGPIP